MESLHDGVIPKGPAGIESEDDIKRACEAFCKAADLEYYIYAVVRGITSLNAPQVTTYTNYPDAWMKSYLESEMQKHDPVVKYCFENDAPICWDKLVQLEQYVNPVGASIMEKAAECGLANGLSIPIKGAGGEMAIFSLATKNIDRIGERLARALSHAQTLGTQLLDAFRRLKSNAPEFSQGKLTTREKECLFWACEGKTTWEISKIVDVSERTIIFHLASATNKLGAANRQHAVAKAIISGLIKPML